MGGWVGGWVGEWSAFFSLFLSHARLREWVGGWVGGWEGRTAPVGKDHERKVFPIKVTNGLGGFVGRVGEPHTAGLLGEVGGWVGGWVRKRRFECATVSYG